MRFAGATFEKGKPRGRLHTEGYATLHNADGGRCLLDPKLIPVYTPGPASVYAVFSPPRARTPGLPFGQSTVERIADPLAPPRTAHLQKSTSERYCDARLRFVSRGTRRLDVSGCTNAEELHEVMTRHAMLRRLKADVLTQLPPKRRQRILLTLGNGEPSMHMRVCCLCTCACAARARAHARMYLECSRRGAASFPSRPMPATSHTYHPCDSNFLLQVDQHSEMHSQRNERQ